jgi:hypothetical protein
MGAPFRNRNNTRHGLRAGQLPKGAAYIKRECDVLRREIEQAVADVHGGSVSLYHAALIQTCIRWERHAMLIQRWLRLESDTMDAATRLAYSRDIARASAERDKALLTLGLNASDSRSIIDALYSTPHEPDPSGIEAQASDAQSTEATTTTPTEGSTDDRDADTDTGPSV